MASLQETMLKEIADAIREKEGSTGPIPAEEFANRIRALETGTDTYDADAKPEDIRLGKTAYVRGKLITGTIPDTNNMEPVIVPTTKTITVVNRGYYTTSLVSVLGAPALLPENIKKGVEIFRVTGTYTGG